MRIAVLAPRFPPRFDGVGDHAAKFASALIDSGAKVLVLTEGEARDLGIVHAESVGPQWSFCAAIRAARMARRFEAEVFYVQYTPFVYGVRSFSPIVFALVGRLLRANVAVYVHEAFYKSGSAAASTRLKGFLLGARDLLMISLAESIFVAHSQRKGELLRIMPWRRADSIVIAPTGANVEPAGNRRWSPPDVIARRRKLIAFGIISPRRRLELIIDALVILIERGSDIELDLVGRVGDTDYFAALNSRVQVAGVADRVTWPGALDAEQASQAFLEADALLFASTDGATGSSSVLLSALAHGIPVVAVNTAYDEDVFSQCIQHAEPNALSLADAIDVTLNDLSQASRLGAMGARLYDEYFRWSTMTGTIVANLRKLKNAGQI